jgi:NADH-quinone oxidoreductase subunit E
VSRFTPERAAIAQEIIGRYPVPRSALIPLIHLAQEQDGYVAEDAMEHIAELIGCTPAEVYGTGTFYEMFKFHPVGKYVVGVCTNISCLLMGAEQLLAHAEDSLGVRVGGTTEDGTVTLEEVECIAACTVAPCVQVNYRYFPSQTEETFDRLIADLRAGRHADEVPVHGTLGRVRQHVEPSRWAGTGTAPPRTPEAFPGPALRGGGGGPATAGDPAATPAATPAPAPTTAPGPTPAATPDPTAAPPAPADPGPVGTTNPDDGPGSARRRGKRR